jgi:hypothetical protein
MQLAKQLVSCSRNARFNAMPTAEMQYTQYGESKSPPRRLHKPNPSQSCRAATSPHASPVLAERQLYGPTHAVT